MLNPRTPGVYVQEISLLPPSVAPVATAIPAFIGYTQKRGDGFPEDTPKRITSLVDYEQIFGGPFDENYEVTIEDDPVDSTNNPPVITVASTYSKTSPYLLYYAVQHYFANGGGPCYIVSVGLYDYDDPYIDPVRFTAGVDVLEQEDEPTLLLIPEAIGLDSTKRTDLNNQMLTQCNKIQDRFALMDVFVNETRASLDPLADATDFRNEVGTEYLKYGAAYYPSLKTTITNYYDKDTVNIVDSRASPLFDKEPLSTLLTGTTASVPATGEVTVDDYSLVSSLHIDGVHIPFAVGADNDFTAAAIITAININSVVISAAPGGASNEIALTAVTAGSAGNALTVTYNGSGVNVVPMAGGSDGPDVASTGTITVADYSLITTLVVDGQQILFEPGEDNETTASSIEAAIDGNGAVTVSASIDPEAADVVIITANTPGPDGNLITLAKNGGAVSLSGATLKGGAEDGKVAASATLTITSGFKKILGNSFKIGSESPIIATDPAIVKATAVETATALANAINGLASVSASANGTVITIKYATKGVTGNDIKLEYSGTSGARFSGLQLEGGTGGDDTPDVTLYQRIITKLNSYKVSLYPSAAMAGIYARVDRNRGVWKAPANVSVNMVEKPNVMVSADEQGDLNVDPNTGKSINVIRSFAGKGILVWGARTLAGNDNEWRYVPVRRLFIFIEESIEKASEPFVFEPNDANTWVKMKGMIENFLTSLWRDGALAGAVPADAFFVKVGLGETMTSLDILEGKLNIEVGIAAVRPAEFIILKFSHKLQES